VIRQTATGVELDVRVIPRAKDTRLAGERDGALLVRVAAPPVDDAANDRIVDYFARLTHRPRSAIRFVSGAHGRRKRLAIDGITVDSMREFIRDQQPR
jgi:uncharacterized protein YggU (UPF0235/DUF167 family)